MNSNRLLGLVLAGAMSIGFTATSQASTVYSNDFSANASGFTGANTIQTAPNGVTFLGVLTQGAEADLTLSGLAPHSSITLTFDMYGLLTLDGNGGLGFGPDYFDVKANGSTVLLHDTFSAGWANNGLAMGSPQPFQSYCGVGNPSGSCAAGTGSASFDSTGFGYSRAPGVNCLHDYGCESTYNFSFTLNDSASSIIFNFIGNSNQAWPDEGYGIDNVVVTTNGSNGGTVPEPITLSLFGAGLAGAVATRRRKKTTA